jgi:hypothetical protein
MAGKVLPTREQQPEEHSSNPSIIKVKELLLCDLQKDSK